MPTTTTTIQPITDTSLMPFGMHRGKALANVPAKYLLWLLDNGCSNEGVKRYILDNIDALRAEALDNIKNQNSK